MIPPAAAPGWQKGQLKGGEMLKSLTPCPCTRTAKQPWEDTTLFSLLLVPTRASLRGQGVQQEPEQRPNGASEAEAKGGRKRPWLLQGQPVPQTTPHHLSSEQTLSWFWSADLEHFRGILLELALECILTFDSIMQACLAKPSWILSQNRNSGMKKTPILSKGARA